MLLAAVAEQRSPRERRVERLEVGSRYLSHAHVARKTSPVGTVPGSALLRGSRDKLVGCAQTWSNAAGAAPPPTPTNADLHSGRYSVARAAAVSSFSGWA